MNLDIQFKIKSDANYQKYLRENSSWYKVLNRSPEMFSSFVSRVREDYKLRPSDKISRAIDAIDMIQNIVSNIK